MGNPLPDIDDNKVLEIVNWLRENYEGIRQACEQKGLPKPPPW